MNKPINKEYLENSFKNFFAEILEHRYLHNDDSSVHSHSNKNTLDKIGESNSGTLLFDGKEFSDGQDGTPGINGKSAYELAVENGFDGTIQEWLASLKGDPGQNGEDADISNITPDSIGAASKNHIHGNMKTIIYSTTEPITVAEGEIVMVYEE